MTRFKLFLATVVMTVPTMVAFAPPASACMGEVCDTINRVCMKVTKTSCVG